MSDKTRFNLRNRNPDVLTCIANLSNDEVFTPPEYANQMLDTLGEMWFQSHEGNSLWENPEVRFLDPCTKSGVFLREITSRLNAGLTKIIPETNARIDHIMKHQVFGIAITHLTSLLSRRSVYCSKDALSIHSIGRSIGRAQGNIWFERVEHTWEKGRCIFCGASQTTLDRGGGMETYAYNFIHNQSLSVLLTSAFSTNMQFDVVIGNPPYQLDDGGYGASAAPIYHLFVEKAIQLDPRFAVFVTPSRWMTGGKGLDKFRDKMLNDRRLKKIVDFPKLYEGFPGVKIRGGISYFLWERDYNGPCEYQTIWNGAPTGPAVKRDLDTFDVLVRRNEAISILEKVKAMGEPPLSERISSRKPFGHPTNFHGKPTKEGLEDPILLYGSQKKSWIERNMISVNQDLISKWKVLMTAVQGTSAAVETKFLSRPIVAPPDTACSETYLVAGSFDTEEEASNLATYLETRFLRFLVSLRKAAQHATRDVYAFVPDISLSQSWNDEILYKRYELEEADIRFIESQVKAHDDKGTH
jgi:site-specific DNA-methyltransferase (adenine-specific)